MIDFGFVVSSFVPLVLYWMFVFLSASLDRAFFDPTSDRRFGPNHLRAVWRLSLGLGVVPALAVLLWRLRMEEPDRFKRDSMKNAKIPYWLIIKRYWVGLLAISASWFLYDFIVYPVRFSFLLPPHLSSGADFPPQFGLYSTTVVNNITGGSDSLSVVFAWGIVIK